MYLELDERNFGQYFYCLEAVQVWIGNHKQKLNPDKTKSILISKDQIKDYLKSSLIVSLLSHVCHGTRPVSKNLGFTLDPDNSIGRRVGCS